MKRLLSNWIYDKDTDFLVTFNYPDKREDCLEMLSIALDALYGKEHLDSKNIKTFSLNDFRLIYCNPVSGLSYIQEYPDKGKESIIYAG